MNYPLISEYVEAIRSAEDNFSTLTNLRPVMENGRPFMSSGNFAVVFKMKDIKTGKLYAVKCFSREEERRERSYRLIADELDGVYSPYLTSIKYLENELFVDTRNSDVNEFPVLLMDWVEGQTLDAFIRENINDEWMLSQLCRNFCQMGAWLLEQPFAHGDLKPENIMVGPDAMPLLVDYDGMYVPAMKGEVARELGSPDYRHPLRTEKDFDEHIDDFPLASIALSLKAISLDPSLLQRYAAPDRLLFSAADYTDLSKCEVLKEVTSLYSDSELQKLHSISLLVSSQKSLPSSLSQMLIPDEAEDQVDSVELLSTEVTDEDLAEAWKDEYGVLYSKDKKRLLKCKNWELTEYVVREGTRAICDEAFRDCHNLALIVISDSLISIGDKAFWKCKSLTSITLPKDLREIKGNAFAYSNVQISNKSPHFKIENGLLIQDKSIICVNNKNSETILIPNYITHIDDWAFSECKNLNSIELPDNLTTIGDYAFYKCKNLTEIKLPDSLISIGDCAFSGCENLTEIKLPNNLNSIGNYAFCECTNLTSIVLPDSLTSLGRAAFNGCHNLDTIVLSDRLTSIRDKTFLQCTNLTSVVFSNSLTSIGYYAFEECENLTSVTLPEGLVAVGEDLFEKCDRLQEISIRCEPDSDLHSVEEKFKGLLPSELHSIIVISYRTNVTDGDLAETWKDRYEVLYSRDKKRLIKCKNNVLTQKYVVLEGTKAICDCAFDGCKDLTSITLPEGIVTVGKDLFEDCSNLQEIFIGCESDSDLFSVEEKFKRILPTDLHNKIVISYRTNVTYEDLSEAWEDDYGVLYSKDKKRLIKCKNNVLTKYDVLEGTKVICDSAFFLLKSLKEIKLADSLISIGHEAFGGCRSLNSIVLPNSLTLIRDNTFEGCKNLTEINLSNNLTSIGDEAFKLCESLTKIKFPDSLISIGLGAFFRCNNLNSIVLPNSLTSIGVGAFWGCYFLTSVVLPDNLTLIRETTFERCNSLTIINLPNNLTTIGNEAFEYCGHLDSIVLPDSLVSI